MNKKAGKSFKMSFAKKRCALFVASLNNCSIDRPVADDLRRHGVIWCLCNAKSLRIFSHISRFDYHIGKPVAVVILSTYPPIDDKRHQPTYRPGWRHDFANYVGKKCIVYGDTVLFLFLYTSWGLNHWGRVTHMCVSELTISGSDKGLAPRST